MIDRKPVALGPVTIKLPDIVKTGWVIISRLEVLRLKEPVLVRKLVLPQDLLSLSPTQPRKFRGMDRVTCNDRRLASDDGLARWDESLLNLRSRSHHRLAIEHDRLLNIASLGLDDIGGLLNGHVIDCL